MSIGLLIITHEGIGQELIRTAAELLGVCPLTCQVIPVPLDCDTEIIRNEVHELVAQMDTGDGVLVLTDMYGSTPANIANGLSDGRQTQVIAGINLPMLIRILNYPQLGLTELAEKAISGGRDGVLLCNSNKGD